MAATDDDQAHTLTLGATKLDAWMNEWLARGNEKHEEDEEKGEEESGNVYGNGDYDDAEQLPQRRRRRPVHDGASNVQMACHSPIVLGPAKCWHGTEEHLIPLECL